MLYEVITDSFTVSVSDGKGGTATITVNVTVDAVNDVPVAVDDNLQITRDTQLTGNVAGNDTPSGDGGNIWAVTSDVSHGTLVFNSNGSFTYDPTPGYSGSDSFTYSITDTDGDVSSATVYITIQDRTQL